MPKKILMVVASLFGSLAIAATVQAADKPMPSGDMPDHPHTQSAPAPKGKLMDDKGPKMPSGDMPNYPQAKSAPAPQGKLKGDKGPKMPSGDMPDHPHTQSAPAPKGKLKAE